MQTIEILTLFWHSGNISFNVFGKAILIAEIAGNHFPCVG